MLPALLLCAAACSDDNDGTDVPPPSPTPDKQEVTCAIQSPVEGAEIDMSGVMTIQGKASVNVGSIETVILKVGGVEVSAVSSVPFSYDYTFEKGQTDGNLKIELSVLGDQGGQASCEVNVILKKSSPEPAGDEIVDSRDNHVYRVVQIGTQIWMAENLAYLPCVYKAAAAADANGEPRYFVLNYDGEDVAAAKATDEYKKYGVLYNWYAAMNEANAAGGDAEAVPSGVQGICPEGWHLPSKAEWKILEEYVASQLDPVQGNGWYNDFDGVWVFDEDCKNVWSALAGLEGWGESLASQENPDLANGPRDTFHFSAIPAGQCWQTGTFGFSESSATFWATDLQSYGSGTVGLNSLQYNLDYSKSGLHAARGYSVRCLKN